MIWAAAASGSNAATIPDRIGVDESSACHDSVS